MKKLVLSAFAFVAATVAFAQPVHPIISEIVEGSGNNKGFEIFNPTDTAMYIGDYDIVRYNNGALTPSGGTLNMDDVWLDAGDVWVVINGQTVTSPNSPACDSALQAMADQLGGDYPDPCYNNGNDAVTIELNGEIVDLFGKIGEDPDPAWTAPNGAWWSMNHTLIRKPTVQWGITTNPVVFDITAQWDTVPEDTWDSLGFHTTSFALGIGDSPVELYEQAFVFPNPAVNGRFTIKATDRIEGVRIFDMAGRMIFNERNYGSRADLMVELDPELRGLFIAVIDLKGGAVLTQKISLK